MSGGYGLTEAQPNDAESHHRLNGTLGAAVQPLRFLSAALMLDGRWDKHPDDVLGSSSSAVGEPRLLVRAAQALGNAVAVGGQLSAWMPGGEAPSLRPEATTLDATALLTYAPPGSELAMALNAGFRVDESAAAVDAPRRLRPGDRLSLQLSDSNAVLLGLGASKRFHAVELLGELTWDLLVGARAPSAIESPLRAGLGARYHVTKALQAELRSEVTLGERPPSGPTAPFAPIEPRLAVLAGLRWTLPFGAPPKTETAPPVPGTASTTTPVVAASGSVRGRVTAESGESLAGAQVIATSSGTERSTETGADGAFTIDDVPVGATHVVVKAAGYEDGASDTRVDARAPATSNLVLKRKIKPGQLRGLVRSFNGKPLAATVRVEPINVETTTDADGAFQIEVPPGAYEVVIAAPGHAGQRRPVQVEENGVTVLNADLRQGP